MAMAASGSAMDDTNTLSYEQARDELVQVVNRMEQGGATLEESLQLWERGEALAARCQQWLDGARARLTAASPTADPDDETSGRRPADAPTAGAGDDEVDE